MNKAGPASSPIPASADGEEEERSHSALEGKGGEKGRGNCRPSRNHLHKTAADNVQPDSRYVSTSARNGPFACLVPQATPKHFRKKKKKATPKHSYRLTENAHMSTFLGMAIEPHETTMALASNCPLIDSITEEVTCSRIKAAADMVCYFRSTIRLASRYKKAKH